MATAPVTGDLNDVATVVTGRDWVMGEDLSPEGRAITAGASALPLVGGSIARRGIVPAAGGEIRRYADFASVREEGVDAIHHLVEKRFYAQLGFRSQLQAERNLLAVGIDNATHGPAGKGQLTITDIIRDAIGYERSSTAGLQEIWNAHKDAYQRLGHDDWAEVIWEAYFDGKGLIR